MEGGQPKASTSYGGPTVGRNRKPDRGVDAAPLTADWLAIRFWEHAAVADAVAEEKHAIEHRDEPPTFGALFLPNSRLCALQAPMDVQT